MITYIKKVYSRTNYYLFPNFVPVVVPSFYFFAVVEVCDDDDYEYVCYVTYVHVSNSLPGI